MPDDFLAWCRDLLSPLGSVRTLRMFGAHGLYLDGLFIAIIAGDRLYLKADDSSRPLFAQAGGEVFEYSTAAGKRGVLGYFSAPAEAMDSPAQMLPWARLAMASALRARASKPPAKPRAAAAATKAPPRKTAARKARNPAKG